MAESSFIQADGRIAGCGDAPEPPAGASPDAARSRRWLEENAEALDDSNAHVERHGLPLAKHRQF